ncbi:MAG: hypothetical protein CBD21_02645 [bacterium TMED161]|nr:MAG: hypothetical protein CBD21_02645 [bacterium TMED161]
MILRVYGYISNSNYDGKEMVQLSSIDTSLMNFFLEFFYSSKKSFYLLLNHRFISFKMNIV